MRYDNLLERQEALDLKIPETATVIGCGGTGFWTGVFLGMSGVKNLILVDDDIVENSNLNRLPLPKRCLRMEKVRALEEFVRDLRGGVTRVETHKKRIESEEDCQILRGSVFCCTDNLKSQQLIKAFCEKNRKPYRRIGYDGTILNVSKAFPLSFGEVEDQRDGYTVTPSWVVPAVTAAALGVFAELKADIQVMDDMSKIMTRDSTFTPIRDIVEYFMHNFDKTTKLGRKVFNSIKEELKEELLEDEDMIDEVKEGLRQDEYLIEDVKEELLEDEGIIEGVKEELRQDENLFEEVKKGLRQDEGMIEGVKEELRQDEYLIEEAKEELRQDEYLFEEVKKELLEDENLTEEVKKELLEDEDMIDEVKEELRQDEKLTEEVKKELRQDNIITI